jgi:pimeloyl-ACP methyl ester carboxylesterase
LRYKSKGILVLIFYISSSFFGYGRLKPESAETIKSVKSFDNLKIVYSLMGEKEPALIFIHGGFADKSFWKHQLASFKTKYMVVAMDLAGHGDSGDDRRQWGITPFSKDVCAVINKSKIKQAILIGNSLGAEVALQVARILPKKIMAVVAVDTLHLLNRQVPASRYRETAKALRENFTATMKEMVASLFHPDTHPELRIQVEKRMLDNSPEMAAALVESFITLNLAGMVKGLNIPIRCINGDLYPTNIEKNREIYQNFNAIILPQTGHYPMLEKPQLFNKTLEEIVKNLTIK